MEFRTETKSIPVTAPPKKGRLDGLMAAIRKLSPNSNQCIFIPLAGMRKVAAQKGAITTRLKKENIEAVVLTMEDGLRIWRKGESAPRKPRKPLSQEARDRMAAAQTKRWEEKRKKEEEELLSSRSYSQTA